MSLEKNKNKIKCSACGTSQVNHRLMFTLRFIDELVSIVGRIYMPIFAAGNNVRLIYAVEKFLFNLLHTLGIIRYDKDIEKTVNGRSRLIWEEAKRRGIEMEQLMFFGKPIDHFRAKINGEIVFFNSLPIPIWMPHKGYTWVDDKLTFAGKLKKIDIPSPKTKKILFWSDALKAFGDMQKPIIIKPQFGSLGRHTTTNINTEDELKKAFDLAREITFSMIAQEHLFIYDDVHPNLPLDAIVDDIA